MNICLIGDSLTSLALAKNLINKNIKVFVYYKNTKNSSFQSRTIGISKNNFDFFDKEIINFISENGGQVYEIELRLKFLQPRTSMWRAVKRLERQGIVEIEKKDLQNIVKLTSKLEDPDE